VTDAVSVDAPAKVNLFLRVLRKRDDGFHELETLFQAVDLSDHLVLRRAEEGVRLEVDGPDLGPVDRNLAFRAARAFLETTGPGGGVDIRLTKRIPAGAGLAGGSSDAAAVLRALEMLYPDGPAPEEIARMAAGLGSDVLFFLGGSTFALGRGRGELLEPLPALEERAIVLVLPPVHVPTGPAYGALSVQRESGFGPSEEARRLGAPPPASWSEIAVLAHNDFEMVVPMLHPEVARALTALSGTGGRPALLSGSGAACFALYPDESAAATAACSLEAELGWPAPVARTLTAFPAPRFLGR